MAPDAGTFAREHAEPRTDWLAPLVSDRTRIVQSSAFRRLQHKTQVFVVGRDDHFRTRLTHTLEVADLARLIAAALGLSTDLAEVVSLAHDLGHPPFGHAGERALDECLRAQGGFEHNRHALRVVEFLEHPYPAYRGLNLTRVVRECLAKHTTRYDQPGDHPLQDGAPPPLEGQIAATADELAYSLHDLADGLHAGLIRPDRLAGLALWQAAYDGPDPTQGEAWRGHIRPAIDAMQRLLIEDLLAETRRRLCEAGVDRQAAALTCRAPLVQHSDGTAAARAELNALLRTELYCAHTLIRMDNKAARIVRELFDAYVQEPRLLPPRFALRVAEQGAARVAADYLAGMTDRFCRQEHARLFDARTDA